MPRITKTKWLILDAYRAKPNATVTELAEQIGVSKQYVSQVLDKAGLGRGELHDVTSIARDILDWTGWTQTELAELTGVGHASVVHRWLNGSKATQAHATRLILIHRGLLRARNSEPTR